MLKYAINNFKCAFEWMNKNPDSFSTFERRYNWIRFHWWNIGGSASCIFGFPVYGLPEKDKDTLLYKIIDKTYALARKLDAMKYWFYYRYVPRHKYYLVDTKLEPGYYEQDYRMLHACFALLEEHYHEAKNHCEISDEEEALYHWWKVERPANHEKEEQWMRRLYDGKHLSTTPVSIDEENPANSLYEIHTPKFDEEEAKDYDDYLAFRTKVDKDDNVMLKRLVEIRRELWT